MEARYPRHMDTDWQDQSACANHDTSLFFAEKEDPHYEWAKEKAIGICRSCPVIMQCREYSAIRGIREGIWGGQTWTDRRHLRRDFQRGAKKPRHFPLDAIRGNLQQG